MKGCGTIIKIIVPHPFLTILIIKDLRAFSHVFTIIFRCFHLFGSTSTLFLFDQFFHFFFLVHFYSPLTNEATNSIWLELMALMSYYFARLWKHISSIFGTIGRREHIQRFLTILRNFGMREPINGILNTSLLEIKGRLYRLLHIINEFSHLRIHSFPLINIPS